MMTFTFDALIGATLIVTAKDEAAARKLVAEHAGAASAVPGVEVFQASFWEAPELLEVAP